MDNNAPKTTSRYGWVATLAGVYLVILYMALCAVASTVGYDNRQKIPFLAGTYPTPTATVVPTPEILAHRPGDYGAVRFVDFTYGLNDWRLYYSKGKVEAVDGKLVLQSNADGYVAIAGNQNLILPGGKYYIQADLITDIDTDQAYGLVFGLDNHLANYYLFEVVPRIGMFRLLKHTQAKWSELVPFSPSHGTIKSYPEVNTLSVYFNNGEIGLFINGKSMASYSDKEPFQFVGVGGFVDNFGFRLIMDNFFAYNDK